MVAVDVVDIGERALAEAGGAPSLFVYESPRVIAMRCMYPGVWGAATLLLLGVGCSDEVVLGEQCPSPVTGEATVDPLADGGVAPPEVFYGTSCAPCDGDEVRLDERGCPVYVTFETCGGDICVDGRLFQFRPPAIDDDAGVDDDSGVDDDAGEASDAS